MHDAYINYQLESSVPGTRNAVHYISYLKELSHELDWAFDDKNGYI
jgi:hypothetical protein